MLDEKLALFRIDQNDHVDFVKLQVTATGIAKGPHDLPVSPRQIGIELLE